MNKAHALECRPKHVVQAITIVHDSTTFYSPFHRLLTIYQKNLKHYQIIETSLTFFRLETSLSMTLT